jgi:hypothetical protein
MKYIPTVVLMFWLGVPAVHAQQKPVTMKYSGSNVATTIDLGAGNGAVTDEELFAGNGALGQFTYRELHADGFSSTPPDNCSATTNLFFQIFSGSGVFRFQDGSLMTVNVTGGGICADITLPTGQLTETYQITGGTGRFKSASGNLTLTGTLLPILSDPSGNPKLLTNTGEFEGMVSTVQ